MRGGVCGAALGISIARSSLDLDKVFERLPLEGLNSTFSLKSRVNNFNKVISTHVVPNPLNVFQGDLVVA